MLTCKPQCAYIVCCEYIHAHLSYVSLVAVKATMPSAPTMLPGANALPTPQSTMGHVGDVDPGSVTTLQLTAPIPEAGGVSIARLCDATIQKTLGDDRRVTHMELSGTTVFAQNAEVSPAALTSPIPVSVCRTSKQNPGQLERVPTVGDNQRMYGGINTPDGVSVVSSHLIINGAGTNSTTLTMPGLSPLDKKQHRVMWNRYPKKALNMSAVDIVDAHDNHRESVPLANGATQIGYVIPINDDGTSNGATPMHAFLGSRDKADPIMSNKISVDGKDKVVLSKGDMETIAMGLASNLKHNCITGPDTNGRRELAFQIRTPEHSRIEPTHGAHALITAKLYTERIGEDTVPGDSVENHPTPQSEQQALISSALVESYKPVFDSNVQVPLSGAGSQPETKAEPEIVTQAQFSGELDSDNE